LYSFEGLV
jgi:hypothetical protein